jgi:hypothetical protein
MRHLLVHRPRLLGFNQVYGSGGGLYIKGGDFGGNLRICHHLPRQPQRAWIESLSPNDPSAAYLEEHAGLTLSRLHRSTVTLVEAVAAELTSTWQARRRGGVDQRRWREQWPERTKAPPLGFAGYAPGERPIAGDRIVLNGVDITRFRAAQLDDDARKAVWGESDG